MQTALFIHRSNDINFLAKRLIQASTIGGAKALGLDKGQLVKNMDADIISFKLPDTCNIDNLCTSILLHTKNVDNVFIAGDKIELS